MTGTEDQAPTGVPLGPTTTAAEANGLLVRLRGRLAQLPRGLPLALGGFHSERVLFLRPAKDSGEPACADVGRGNSGEPAVEEHGVCRANS